MRETEGCEYGTGDQRWDDVAVVESAAKGSMYRTHYQNDVRGYIVIE